MDLEVCECYSSLLGGLTDSQQSVTQLHDRDTDEMVSFDPSETRTKESNMYASIRVENPSAH